MTQDEIIRMAQKAGFEIQEYGNGTCHVVIYNFQNSETDVTKELERFAALVAAHAKSEQINLAYQQGYEDGSAHEREACAKVCEERADSYKYATDPWAHEHISEANTCAAAIRARGNNAGN